MQNRTWRENHGFECAPHVKGTSEVISSWVVLIGRIALTKPNGIEFERMDIWFELQDEGSIETRLYVVMCLNRNSVRMCVKVCEVVYVNNNQQDSPMDKTSGTLEGNWGS